MSILMLTGLSGAGKSTLARALQGRLEQAGHRVALVDGDQFRLTLSRDLGFSETDRRENIRRLMAVAAEKKRAGFLVLVAAINPFDDQRRQLAATLGALTVYVACPLPVLVARDTKGLYRRALLPDTHPEKLHNLTGVNDRYDVPPHPDFTVDTATTPVETAAERLYEFVVATLRGLPAA
ncbi:adenylyl-sulfate kinase [Hymenobacter persicinus]|uniref:Adenylyl-sulfate kinase n=1 Tax=Hymenobacter persicinus TaxID=2025506 RepID=A0A4Q5LGY2_9BACT|nr:adenylyl-sulfate kinase [Hymenobacter persicinus]RYU83250.1 adenylyl-sulfate kinase [Hymenobacter persicinus]